MSLTASILTQGVSTTVLSKFSSIMQNTDSRSLLAASFVSLIAEAMIYSTSLTVFRPLEMFSINLSCFKMYSF